MGQIRRVIKDVPADKVQIETELLEVDGFTVTKETQDDGLFTLTGAKDDAGGPQSG
jgi:hypothetical protein